MTVSETPIQATQGSGGTGIMRLLLKQETAPAARNQTQHSLLCGSPATVTAAIAEIDRIGVGGLILVFRLGPMPYEVAAGSIRLFMEKVAPQFRRTAA